MYYRGHSYLIEFVGIIFLWPGWTWYSVSFCVPWKHSCDIFATFCNAVAEKCWSSSILKDTWNTSQVCLSVCVIGRLYSGCPSLLIVSAPPAPSDGAREEDQAAAVHDAAGGQQRGQELAREHQLSGHRSTQRLWYCATPPSSPQSNICKSSSRSFLQGTLQGTLWYSVQTTVIITGHKEESHTKIWNSSYHRFLR